VKKFSLGIQKRQSGLSFNLELKNVKSQGKNLCKKIIQDIGKNRQQGPSFNFDPGFCEISFSKSAKKSVVNT
jgi:hypothetical protein